MKLRSRLDVFRAALWSALGATQLVACGGTALLSGGDPGGSGGAGPSNPGASGASAAGSGQSGATSGQSGSTSGQGGAATAGALGTAGAANRYPCTGPQGDLYESFVQCNGFKHREKVGACASQVPRPDAIPHSLPMGTCNFDADCTDKPHGWCSNFSQIGDTHCEYGCVTDSECGSNQICECQDPVGHCVPADCKTDADCQSGFLCRSYDSTGGCNQTVYTCQSPADACGNETDCNSGDSVVSRCRFDDTTHSFQCIPGTCSIGRPFLVQGAQRLAPGTARADWHELAWLPRLSDLDAALRAHLTEEWTRIALMEHGSIAAFARFSLQLISLGAPADLIERTTAAMVDETKHAKACFGVASHYAGAPIGPGRLAIERSLDESSLEEIVLNAIREGCVGETIAAIEAREAAEYTADPALRELLLVISEDETRHAELAYRFLKWALAVSGSPALERAVRRELAALATETPPAQSAPTDSDLALLRHGIVPNALRQVIRWQALTQVILPGSRALFTTEARTAPVISASV